MLINRITFKNFLVFGKVSIDLNKSPLLLFGSNGSGKSSIIDGITVPLFKRGRGTDAKGGGLDNLIKYGQNSMGIKLEFSLNENNYTLILKKDRHSTTVHELFCNNELITNSAASTLDRVKKLLGIDYDSLVSSAFLLQGTSGYFMEKKAGERKTILMNILGLDEFKQYARKAAEVRRHLRTFSDQEKGKIQVLNDKLKQKEIAISNIEIENEEVLKNKLSKITIELENTLKQAWIQKDQYTQLKDQFLKTKQEVVHFEDLEQKVQLPYIDPKDIDSLKIQLEEFLKASKVEEELDKITQNQIAIIINEGKRLSKEIEDINKLGSTCNTCKQGITIETKQTISENLHSQLNKHQIKFKELQEMTLICKKNIEEHIFKATKVNQELSKKEMQYTQKQSLVGLTQDLVKILGEKRELLKAITEKISIIQIDSIQSAQRTLSEEKLRLETLIKRIDEKKSAKAFLSNDIFQLKVELQKIHERHEFLSKEHGQYDELAHAYSDEGIPTLIIKQIVPLIEAQSNRILEQLSNGELRTQFHVDESGLEVAIIKSDGTKNDYSLCSSGQRFRIDLSLRYALCKLLQSRAGTKIETIFIDEGMGSLDKQGKESFKKYLDIASKEFKRIIVVTHIEEIAELFTNRIQVDKGVIKSG